MIQDLGKGCNLAKADIKSAFRLLPLNRQEFELVGFKFEGKYYFDKCLPFGCSISCSIFEKFSTFLEFCVKNKAQLRWIIHYLDDFLMAGRRNTNECAHMLGVFKDCLHALGVPIADDKTEGPNTIIVFLGLELDSNEMVVRIPKEKVNDIVQKIKEILGKKRVTLRMMQSLIGVLNFACRAIVPGRPFCRRLVNSICGLTKPYHHIRINKGIRRDLQMWLTFFDKFNGVSLFHDRFWVSNSDIELYTDSAAGVGLGFGAYFQGRWISAAWPDDWFTDGITDDITVLEIFPLLVALHIWGNELENKKVTFRCDNMSVVCVINAMSSKSDNIMTILRAFTLKCLELNIVAKANHIQGKNNVLSDSLSRLQVGRFREMAPGADQEPAEMPSHLWSIFRQQPESL